MAHNWFLGDRGTLEPQMVDIYGVVNVGAAGALTFQQWIQSSRTYSAASAAPASGGNVRGVKSITRTGTGAWTIVLDQPYQRLLQFQAYSQVAGGLAAAPNCAVNLTGTNVNSTSSPQVNVQFLSSASTGADPASGEQIVFHLELQMGSGPGA